MLELDELQQKALLFIRQTDEMLVAAEQGSWDDFLDLHLLREESMALLMREAGDALLERLPMLRDPLQRALDKSLRMDDMARARRDELGENLSSVQHTRRLRAAYRN
jgi:hypothetical protein